VEIQPAFPGLTFVRPVDLQNAHDGSNRLFAVEKRGHIYVFENHPDVTDKTLFLNIESRVNSSGSEEGLLGLAFHPQYPDSPYFYVNYTALSPRRTVIERYTVSANPDSADFFSNFVLLEVNQPFPNHNAGQLAFGPDGMLYIGMADGGSGGDPLGNGQNRATLLGSMLRIDVDSRTGMLNYGIPSDNPYVGNPSGYREEIWAYGFRNPWRYSFDWTTGWLWVADVGQNAWEEVDVVEKAGNYGWNIMEGNHCYPSPPCDMTGLELPIWEYNHPGGASRSVTGGYVYRGVILQELVGKFVYAEYVTGEVWAVAYDGVNPAVNDTLLTAPFSVSSFGVDENNNLFLLNYFGGSIWRFLPTVAGVPELVEPRGALSQNSPNPFNPETSIEFTLREAGDARIDVYDVQGRLLAHLASGRYDAGRHRVTWRANDVVSSGIYFYGLRFNGELIDTRRMLLLK
jgi:hypothetical protein